MKEYIFPKDFCWGVASASYQIEGAAKEDGRGESIWDRYCSIPGNVANGDNGDVACDFYHRYKEDIALMKDMGVKGYRFSISWPRIFPNGTGEVNKKGLQFYIDMVDELLANGITPFATLYHWDLPQALQDRGGWANDESSDWFLEYAKVVFEALKDKVKNWMTLNEPFCAAFIGNYEGRHAPGINDFSTAVKVSYNLYVGHGKAVKYFRENCEGEIGIALNLMQRLPYDYTQESKDAAVRADGYLNRWFIDPIIFGKYPEDMVSLYKNKGVVLPEFRKEDLALMSQKLDFIGLNYYNDFYVIEDKSVWPLDFEIKNPPRIPVNARDWPVTEDGFTAMLLRLKNEYGVDKILITENGTATNDVVSLNHTVDDQPRTDYLKRHLAAMNTAMEQGVNVFGYMQWSFCDNFEWAFGYNSRFGIVYIDFDTQERIVKESGKFYSSVIKEGKLTI